jgi:hypothetical protein
MVVIRCVSQELVRTAWVVAAVRVQTISITCPFFAETAATTAVVIVVFAGAVVANVVAGAIS